MVARSGAEGPEVPPGPEEGDHWHAAIGFYVCGTFVGPFPDTKGDSVGIHSHDDGLIHIHPFVERATGRRATLQWFLEEVGVELTATALALPDGRTVTQAGTCGETPGDLRAVVWSGLEDDRPQILQGDFADIRLAQGKLITIAFAAPNEPIPRPPSSSILHRPADVGAGESRLMGSRKVSAG